MEQTRNDQLSAKDAPPKLSCEASRNSWIDGWSKETEAPKNCFSRRFSNKIQITRHIALAVSKFGTKAKSILIFLCLARLDREFVKAQTEVQKCIWETQSVCSLDVTSAFPCTQVASNPWREANKQHVDERETS